MNTSNHYSCALSTSRRLLAGTNSTGLNMLLRQEGEDAVLCDNCIPIKSPQKAQ